MHALILMDVDGVLNPAISPDTATGGPRVLIPRARAALLHDVAAMGTLAWATSYDSSVTDQLDTQSGIPGKTLRIPLSALSAEDLQNPTPKLRRIDRWITRTLQDKTAERWDSIIWIDDQHGPDASDWAQTTALPALLLTTAALTGLTEKHLAMIVHWGRSAFDPRPHRRRRRKQ